jgi:hypothetical protein
MGVNDEWHKQASRLRELARDPAVRSYLLGRLCAESSADQLHDLVQAALAYRERFGASSNRLGGTTAEALRALDFDERAGWKRGQDQVLGQDRLPDL